MVVYEESPPTRLGEWQRAGRITELLELARWYHLGSALESPERGRNCGGGSARRPLSGNRYLRPFTARTEN